MRGKRCVPVAVVATAVLTSACELVAGLDDFADRGAGASAAAPSFLHEASMRAGGPLDDDIWALSLSEADEPFITGPFAQAITLGDHVLEAAPGGTSAYLARLSRDLEPTLATRLSADDDLTVWGLATPQPSDVALGGFFRGTATFDSDMPTSLGGADGFVARYDSQLAVRHVQVLPGDGVSNIREMLQRGQQVIGVGSLTNSIDAPPLTSAGISDGLVVTYEPDGTVDWATSFGATGSQTPKTAALSGDSIIIFGEYTEAFTIDATLFDCAGCTEQQPVKENLFVARYDSSSHSFVDGLSLELSSDAAVWDAAADADLVVVVGAFAGEIHAGSDTLGGEEGPQAFVLAFTIDPLAYAWGVSFAGEGGQAQARAVAMLDRGPVVTGSFRGTLSFGADAAPAVATGDDAFVVAFDSQGNYRGKATYGGAGEDAGLALATDTTGSLVLGGKFSTTIDFGAGPLESAGGSDVFVARLRPML